MVTAHPDWLEQADVESMEQGVGVPVQVETPALHKQPPTDWQALLVALVSQPSGVPAQVAAPDQVQLLAGKHVVLEVLVEQAAAVPVQLPLAVFQRQPRLVEHMVMVTLSEHGVGVPLQARVALLHVHPACPVHAVRLVLSLQAAGVPVQLSPVDAVHAQPGCKAQLAEEVCAAQV